MVPSLIFRRADWQTLRRVNPLRKPVPSILYCGGAFGHDGFAQRLSGVEYLDSARLAVGFHLFTNLNASKYIARRRSRGIVSSGPSGRPRRASII